MGDVGDETDETVDGVRTAHSVVSSLRKHLNKAGPETLWSKKYPLQIVVVNLDPDNTLLLEQQWFDCGDFWEQPFWNIGSYQFQIFSVCESNLCCGCRPKRGVSGGVGFLVKPAAAGEMRSADGRASGQSSRPHGTAIAPSPGDPREASPAPQEMFVWTFANPRIGAIRERCEINNVGSSHKRRLIQAVWKGMADTAWIRSSRCGFYTGNLPSTIGQTTEHANKKIVFVWKPESLSFDEILAAMVTQKHMLMQLTVVYSLLNILWIALGHQSSV